MNKPAHPRLKGVHITRAKGFCPTAGGNRRDVAA